MRLSKAQAVVITLLNLLIAALLSVIFFYPNGLSASAALPSGDDPPDVIAGDDPTPPPHNKFRDAIDGKVSEIVRETRLMGSGDESVVSVHYKSDITYIFGNATVGDLDFDSYGGFLCLISDVGTILKYTYFTGVVTAVGVVEGGYAVSALWGAGTVDEVSQLYFVDYSGEAKVVAQLSGGAVKIFALDTKKAAVVTQPTSTSLKFTEYTLGDKSWTVGRSTRMDDGGCTIEFFDCYDFGESYVISARSYSPQIYDAAVFFSFVPGGDAAVNRRGGGGEKMVRPYAIVPYPPSGYYMLCDVGGAATVMCVEYSFSKYHVSTLGFAFSSARFICTEGKYYACFERESGAELYEISSDLSCNGVSAADGVVTEIATYGNVPVMAGRAPSRRGEYSVSYDIAKIFDINGNRAVSLAIDNATFYDGRRSADGVTFVLSATGGDALSETSGGRDVYIITVGI